MYSDGTDKKSDDHSYCDSDGLRESTCESIGQIAWNWNSCTLDALRQLANVPMSQCPSPPENDDQSSCDGKRRMMLAENDGKVKPVPTASKIKYRIKKDLKVHRARVEEAVAKAGGKKNLARKIIKKMGKV